MLELLLLAIVLATRLVPYPIIIVENPRKLRESMPGQKMKRHRPWDGSPQDKKPADRFQEICVTVNLNYPIALIGDDNVPEIYHSFNQLTQDIEPQDVNDYWIIDAGGAVFRIRIKRESTSSLINRLLSLLGTPERYELEPAMGKPPDEVIASAKLLLLDNQNKRTPGKISRNRG